ncbi:MAG TPA: TrbC/VirB2 family protein [Allosphingosinicella sp.]|jgi:type IV secretion system protein VirB2
MTIPAFPSDPGASGSVLHAAVLWLQGTLLGSLATAVAVIAVASIGFMMLRGQVSFRRAAEVIAGCFILFGASAIAGGLQRAAAGAGTSPAAIPAFSPAVRSTSVEPPPAVLDPYAGAALPAQR